MLSPTIQIPGPTPSNAQPGQTEQAQAAAAGQQGCKARQVRSSTAQAYAQDVRRFIQAGGCIPCSPELLRKYIVAVRLKVAPTTLHRRLTAIGHEHKARGLASPNDDPSVRPLLRALQHGKVLAKDLSFGADAKAKQHKVKAARPLTREQLAALLEYMGRNMKDRRDRALLLLGFATAMRRAELVALNVGDIRFTPDAMLVQSKGRRLAVPVTNGEQCAARAVREWIEHAALETQPEAPLFCRFDRGGDATRDRLDSAWVSVVVKSRLKTAGIDPEPYSAESLRRGRKLEAAKGVIL